MGSRERLTPAERNKVLTTRIAFRRRHGIPDSATTFDGGSPEGLFIGTPRISSEAERDSFRARGDTYITNDGEEVDGRARFQQRETTEPTTLIKIVLNKD